METDKNRPYPRWVVVLGLVIYCALIWVVVIEAAGFAFKSLVHPTVEMADGPPGAAQDGSAR